MFEYKPLEKSAKKEKDYSGRGPIRKALSPLDFILVPIERAYGVIKPIPVLGPIVKFIVNIIAATGIVGLIALPLIILIALVFVIVVWLQTFASPTY